jgi:hypothetical protein
MAVSRLRVKGIAVREGTSLNNHKFLGEELQKAAMSLTGKPILKDHDATVENTIGKVTYSQHLKDKNGVYVPFEGFVIDDDHNLHEKIITGIISEVSIGAYAEKMVKETEESDVLIPIGLHFQEVSLTPTPAVMGTNITKASVQEFVEAYACPDCDMKFDSKEEKDAHMNKKHKEEENMESETKIPETPKIDASVELAKLKEEHVKLLLEIEKQKVEQAKKILEQSKVVEKPAEPVSAAVVKSQLDGYIVETTEDGRMGVRKQRRSIDLSMLGGR